MSRPSYEKYVENVSKIESNYIKKLEVGFVFDNFCDVIKDMYSNLCLHFLENDELFDNKRKASVNRIISYISNG